ncbi:hypothetical protein EDD74_12037 [Faecalimonas umbilicata]|uniref:Uncharacterized protein n=1 Tax=Faecalimonas umbilicata TaxID=1912855 RepID=A0A4R3JIP4_9FIRM|nr:hypothetical protein [Faecalimonas umbilicata]TCS66073.1 hypothetical protein EDD74_12037 [Faecalimonas umbilicata]GBU05671.1 hypothetical protein FAEUMB_22120 [Faecalimonas umbilicata]
MRKKFKRNSRRVLAFMLGVLTMLTAFGTSVTTAFAADGTLHLQRTERCILIPEKPLRMEIIIQQG